MIAFAYDGSINGDWVARYAMRLASRSTPKALEVLHVDDGQTDADAISSGLDRIRQHCVETGVRLSTKQLPLQRTVEDTLCAGVTHGPECFLLCGMRMRASTHGFLAGTVSERLLRVHPCHIVALRVVQPGLLGAPHRFLFPLAGHPRGIQSLKPIMRLFAPDVREAHVLRVMAVRSGLFQRLRADKIRRLRRNGREFVRHVESEIIEQAGLSSQVLEAFVRVSDDWVKEILIHASQHRSQLTCLGAPERTFAQRFFYGNPLERVLRNAPCDLAVYRGIT